MRIYIIMVMYSLVYHNMLMSRYLEIFNDVADSLYNCYVAVFVFISQCADPVRDWDGVCNVCERT